MTTTAPHTAALIEDALFLLDAGEHPERIYRRLGTTAANLEIHATTPRLSGAGATVRRSRNGAAKAEGSSMTTTSFFVPGTPAPQGSKKHVGNGVMIESSKHLKLWRAKVAWAAKQHIKAPRAGAIRLDLHFVMPRPKSHYGTGRNADKLKTYAPASHVQKPDLDKLVRAVGDALTGVAYVDDSQTVGGSHMKRWTYGLGDPPGVRITVISVEKEKGK